MGYPKANWNPYAQETGFIVEINVKELSGITLDHFVTKSDKAYEQVIRIIERKYGLHYPKQKNIPITMTAVQLRADLGLPIEEEKKVST